jgi:hypothetical protein
MVSSSVLSIRIRKDKQGEHLDHCRWMELDAMSATQWTDLVERVAK